MPYKSDAQRRYFHWAKSKGLIKKKIVDEWDEESKGLKLPEKIKKDKKASIIKESSMFKLGFFLKIAEIREKLLSEMSKAEAEAELKRLEDQLRKNIGKDPRTYKKKTTRIQRLKSMIANMKK